MRKKLIWVALIFALSVFALNASAGTKVQVCHIPPDDPTNFHTITVNINALAAHIAHGDIGGACDAYCALLCDDGDACTVDDFGDCEVDGCPVVPEPVDCNDGNGCTTDSCDSVTGCVNEPCDDGQVCNEEIGACENDDNGCPCWSDDEIATIDGLDSQGIPYYYYNDSVSTGTIETRYNAYEISSDFYDYREVILNDYFDNNTSDYCSYLSVTSTTPYVHRQYFITPDEGASCANSFNANWSH